MRVAATLTAATVVAVLGVTMPPAAVAARDLPALPDYKLMIGDAAYLWSLSPGAEKPDAASAPAGTWTVDASPIEDGVVDLHVRAEPPLALLPVEAGPAILVTAVALGGGTGGDVGYERLVRVKSTALPACAGDPCTFEADVSVDLRRLPRLASKVRGLEEAYASIGFTLVRSFGDGTWLQALETNRPNGTFYSGTLSAPEPWVGTTPRLGLFPRAGAGVSLGSGRTPPDLLGALETARLEMVDTTSPPDTTDVRLVATFVGCEPRDGDASLDRIPAQIQTSAGDRVLFRRQKGRDFVDATVPLPVGTTWRVGWESDPATTFDVADRPLLVTAVIRCPRDDAPKVTDVMVAEVVTPSGTPAAVASPAA
ncbi:MAG: hypothetical protein U0667_17925 [Chloroflexota bacterium]